MARTKLPAEVAIPKEGKLEFSMERTTEQMWERAQHAGWSHSRFFMHLIAILIVLRKRDRWVASAASQQKRKSKKKGAQEAHPSL